MLPSQRHPLSTLVLLQHVPRDHQLLYLARALVDLCDPGIPVVPLRRHIRNVPHSPQHLHRLVRRHRGALARRQLRHGRLARVLGPPVLEHRGPPGQQPRRVARDAHVADLVLYRLQLRNGPAERLPLERVPRGAVDGGGGDAQGLTRDSDATAVEGLHGDLEALALLAEDVIPGDADAVEYEVGRRARPDSQFVLLGPQRKPLGVEGNDEGRNAAVLLGFVRRGEYHRGARLVRVGDPRLGAVYDPLGPVVAEHGGGGSGAGVASVPGFRKAEAPDLHGAVLLDALRVGGQVLLLQSVGAEFVDGPQVEAVVGRHYDPDGGAAPADLLHGDRVGEGIELGAAVIGRGVYAHETQLRQLPHRPLGERVLPVPIPRVRTQLLVGEFAAHVPDHLVLLG
mmetsp:Transcript_13145/g.27149  ORF Transcript_13145/g.27149 Transcript_13145/m.27149 type:complete len:397 (+) Transcript_13145:217-1407(+)